MLDLDRDIYLHKHCIIAILALADDMVVQPSKLICWLILCTWKPAGRPIWLVDHFISFIFRLADHNCDPGVNTEQCLYDGGDCCLPVFFPRHLPKHHTNCVKESCICHESMTRPFQQGNNRYYPLVPAPPEMRKDLGHGIHNFESYMGERFGPDHFKQGCVQTSSVLHWDRK